MFLAWSFSAATIRSVIIEMDVLLNYSAGQAKKLF